METGLIGCQLANRELSDPLAHFREINKQPVHTAAGKETARIAEL